jgi:hypothetical protein
MKVTHKCASTTSDNNQELGQIGRAIWERIARIIYDSSVGRSSEDRKSTVDSEREGCEVSDWIMLDATNSRILQRNHRAEWVTDSVRRRSIKLRSGDWIAHLSRLATEIALMPFPGPEVYQEPEEPCDGAIRRR